MADRWLLALETSTRSAGAALLREGGLAATCTLDAQPGVAAELLPAARDLLAQFGLTPQRLDFVAFSQGPGSFTGLRVAATVARMLHEAAGCAVTAVSTLEAMAVGALTRDTRGRSVHAICPSPCPLPGDGERVTLAVLLDAKRGQVYCAAYGARGAHDALEIVSPPGVREPLAWLATLPRPLHILGPAVEKHREAIDARVAASDSTIRVLDPDFWTPQAEAVAAIGWRMALRDEICLPERIVPFYLRPPECEEVYEQRRAEARTRRGE